jgi:sirohydrochlorin ferrochelatase
MKKLLIAAHGSRLSSSNDELQLLVEKVSANLDDAFDGVEVAFLEFASPSIDNVLVDFFKSQATEVVVLPYFLSAGIHVMNDIPREIQKALDQWPDKKITVLPHIGALDTMASVIVEACNR